MFHDSEKTRTLNRRTFMLGVSQGVLLAVLAGRMFYLQVINSSEYKLASDQNSINTKLVAPPRGLLFDRNGTLIVGNKQNYILQLTPELSGSTSIILEKISALINLTSYEMARIQKDLNRHQSFLPIMIRENLTWDEVARISVNTPDLLGVEIESGQLRDYIYKDIGAHVLGYVSTPSDTDIENVENSNDDDDELLLLPGFDIGKSGIERHYDSVLRGRAGATRLEVNSVGRVVKSLDHVAAVPGNNMVLTLDIELQKLATERLGSQSGAVIVMDIHSGEVLVMASTPNFDPSLFGEGISTNDWNALLNDAYTPLNDKAVGSMFAPGSTFKLMTALAGLENKTINPTQKTLCNGHITVGNAVFHCWKKNGHGLLDLVGGIQNSCDVYFYEAARHTGIDKIHDMAIKFGLGKATGIDLPSEKNGFIPSEAWKLRTYHQHWEVGESLINGIGQGYCLVTPIQLAMMVARIANGGFAVQPYLTKALYSENGTRPRPAANWPSLGVSPDSLSLIHQGMFNVSNVPGATAYMSRIHEPGLWLCGKTGTAQVRRISMAERERGVIKNENLPWKERDHALFVAFAPAEAPRYSISVVVEHGGGGSAVAAPIGRDVMLAVEKKGLNPSPNAAPQNVPAISPVSQNPMPQGKLG